MNFVFGYFQRFIKSCRDFNFYNSIINSSVSESLRYFFFLVLLISITVGFVQGWSVSENLIPILNWVENEFPEFKIKDGNLKFLTPIELPYKNYFNDIPVIIDFDTKKNNLPEYSTAVLISEKSLIYKREDIGDIRFNFKNLRDLYINPEFFQQIRKGIYAKTIVLMVILAFFYFSIVKLFQIFSFAVLGLAISTIKKKGFSFKQVFNISVYAFSPVAALSILFGIFIDINTTFSWMAYTGLYSFYMVSAIYNIPSKISTTSSPSTMD